MRRRWAHSAVGAAAAPARERDERRSITRSWITPNAQSLDCAGALVVNSIDRPGRSCWSPSKIAFGTPMIVAIAAVPSSAVFIADGRGTW